MDEYMIIHTYREVWEKVFINRTAYLKQDFDRIRVIWSGLFEIKWDSQINKSIDEDKER